MIRKIVIALAAFALVATGSAVAHADGSDQARIMGLGGHASLQNVSDSRVKIRLSGVHCMYNGGVEGSNLNVFVGAYNPGDRVPPNPNSYQYIEQNDAGVPCFGDNSDFTFSAYDESNRLIGSVTIEGTKWSWYLVEATNPRCFDVVFSDPYQLDFYVHCT
ncbi:hypothetical protein ACFV4N_25295 [Actinosynnema sp. NPDC059797]